MALLLAKQANSALSVSASAYKAWSRPTKCPIEGTHSAATSKVYKPGPVADWIVERDELEESVVKMYDSMSGGGVKQLLAGTGCGKSTKLPLILARYCQTVGVVVLPDRALRRQLYKYVSDVLTQVSYQDVAVSEAYDAEQILCAVKPAVVYMSASDFLCACAAGLSDLVTSSLGYIYIDESHETLPEYYVLRLMTTAGKFKDIRVLMGSATATGESLEARSGGIKRTVHAVKPADMKFRNPNEITRKSPLLAANIKDRVMIFVPSALEMETLITYYEQNAIEVLYYSELSPVKQLDTIRASLSSAKRPLVFLATQLLQTGHTFDIDTVVDCGVTAFIDQDSLTKEVSVNFRRVSMSERIQRCGRVGRHMSGSAYYIDGDTMVNDSEVTLGYECYVTLWCNVLGLDVSSPIYRSGHSQLGSLTYLKSCVLLHSQLHPLVMTHYVNDLGELHRSMKPLCGLMFSDLPYIHRLLSSQVSYDLDSWKHQALRGYPWVTYDVGYKTPCIVPDEWKPITIVAFLLYSDLCQLDTVDSCDMSQIASVKGKRRAPNPSENLSLRYSQRDHDKSRRRHTRVESLDVSSLRVTSQQASTLSSYAGLANNETQRVRAETRSTGRTRRVSRVHSNSKSSSGDNAVRRARLNRVKVDPTQLFNQMIYPMDDKLFDRHAHRQGVVDSQDVRMYEELVRMSVTLADLSDTECDVYFIAIVLQWNRAVLSLIQLRAKPISAVGRLFGVDSERDKLESVRYSAKKLLVAFTTIGRFVGIDPSARQSADGSTARIPVADQQASALYVLQVGNQATRDVVLYLKYHMSVHEETLFRRRGVFLRMRDMSLGVTHTFVADSFTDHVSFSFPKSTAVCSLLFDQTHDYVIFLHTPSPKLDSQIFMRDPVDHELIVVVSVSLSSEDQVLYGAYEVFGADTEWFYYGALPDGTSGSVLVACADGSIVGFHVGKRFAGPDSRCSAFVPASFYLAALG